jgi:hypothetical protein
MSLYFIFYILVYYRDFIEKQRNNKRVKLCRARADQNLVGPQATHQAWFYLDMYTRTSVLRSCNQITLMSRFDHWN